ncbi:MAG: LptE family protein [Mucilaginibacter polytrichastri]|nr:LptE family protein [Mucilaginibacter polytrichastri]
MLRRIYCGGVLFSLLFFQSGCWVYKLNGASIPAAMKTVNVQFFENTAPLVVANLSQNFTEALKDRIRSQTSLAIVRDPGANGVFEGAITGYSIAPAAVQATEGNQIPRAALNRLTITVHVKYTNTQDEKLNFEQDFNKYRDFAGEVSSSEQSLIQQINRDLTEDIFNRAFANW